MSNLGLNSLKDLRSFATNNLLLLAAGTLGLAVITYALSKFAGHVYCWINKGSGTTEKTTAVATQTLGNATPSTSTSPSSSSPSSSSSSSSSSSLKKANSKLASEIYKEPSYQASYESVLLDGGTYRGGPFPKEFMDPQTHQHLIFENIYLGDLRGYYSVDPSFLQQHQLHDSIEEILNLEDMPLGLQKFARDHLENQLDKKGCSELGIKYVLSATQFKPKDTVEATDWSRFLPDLDTLGITRMQISVDDDEFAWEGIKPHLESAFEFIDRARSEGKPCLIHCVKGASRSVTILTAYLVNRCG